MHLYHEFSGTLEHEAGEGENVRHAAPTEARQATP